MTNRTRLWIAIALVTNVVWAGIALEVGRALDRMKVVAVKWEEAALAWEETYALCKGARTRGDVVRISDRDSPKVVMFGGVLDAADHEVDAGYFSIGPWHAIYADPEGEHSEFANLVRLRGKRVVVTIGEVR